MRRQVAQCAEVPALLVLLQHEAQLIHSCSELLIRRHGKLRNRRTFDGQQVRLLESGTDRDCVGELIVVNARGHPRRSCLAVHRGERLVQYGETIEDEDVSTMSAPVRETA